LELEINTDGVPKNLIAMLNHIKFVKTQSRVTVKAGTQVISFRPVRSQIKSES